jgi:AcrR family transcriptional regulator
MIRSGLAGNISIQLPLSSVHSVLSWNLQPPDPASSSDDRNPGPAATTDPAIGRRERRRKEVFERLLSAARHVIVSRGLENATVKDITDAADVGKGTFFLHFRSKEHVLPALIAREGTIYQRALERAQAGESVLSLLDALFSVDPAAVSLDNSVFFRSHLLAVIGKDDVRELSMQSLAANSERIEALMALGQKRGEIRQDQTASDLARLIQQAGLGARLSSLFGRIDASTDYLTASWRLVFSLIQAAPFSAPTLADEAPGTAAREKVPAGPRSRRTR